MARGLETGSQWQKGPARAVKFKVAKRQANRRAACHEKSWEKYRRCLRNLKFPVASRGDSIESTTYGCAVHK